MSNNQLKLLTGYLTFSDPHHTLQYRCPHCVSFSWDTAGVDLRVISIKMSTEILGIYNVFPSSSVQQEKEWCQNKTLRIPVDNFRSYRNNLIIVHDC